MELDLKLLIAKANSVISNNFPEVYRIFNCLEGKGYFKNIPFYKDVYNKNYNVNMFYVNLKPEVISKIFEGENRLTEFINKQEGCEQTKAVYRICLANILQGILVFNKLCEHFQGHVVNLKYLKSSFNIFISVIQELTFLNSDLFNLNSDFQTINPYYVYNSDDPSKHIFIHVLQPENKIFDQPFALLNPQSRLQSVVCSNLQPPTLQ